MTGCALQVARLRAKDAVENCVVRSQSDCVFAKILSSHRHQEWAYAWAGRLTMTHSKLRVDVQGIFLSVSLRGTCLWVRYRRQEAPWLAADAYGPDDPEASLTLNEFRALAWETANETARQLGWIRSCGDLHEAVKLAAGAT